MNEAIKLAIEKGGYSPTFGQLQVSKGETRLSDILTYNFTVLDPLFWQALGKALSWDEKCTCGKPHGDPVMDYGDWLVRSINYFGEVMNGGDTEKFFKELIAVSERSESSAEESNA